jgi:hypothetical protein
MYAPLLSKTGRLPAEHVDNGLAAPCRGHQEGTFFAAGKDDTSVAGECEGRACALATLPAGGQEGLAMRVHDSPNTDGIFQEFRSPKMPMTRHLLPQWGMKPTLCSKISVSLTSMEVCNGPYSPRGC